MCKFKKRYWLIRSAEAPRMTGLSSIPTRQARVNAVQALREASKIKTVKVKR